jgi:vacuolar-type H+-ATPase subunit D/Vma8
MIMDDVSPTRSGLLELKAESRSMREAYSFLDEKRTILASTLARELKAYDEARQALEEAWVSALRALEEAVAWHGLESLQCQPALAGVPDRDGVRIRESAILGVTLLEAEFDPNAQAAPALPPLARACADRFRALTGQAARLAAHSGNLLRLYQEYRRTERCAHALEDVLLPELEVIARRIDDHLEALDLEEAVRVRCLSRP